MMLPSYQGSIMDWDRFVVASDGSVAGLHAESYAEALAIRAGAKVVHLNVLPKYESLVTGSGPGLNQGAAGWETAREIAHGVPSVEICRYAESIEASAVVLGHKSRTDARRRMLGDTADAVARRSLIPTLHVPVGQPAPKRLLLALDGTERGMTVARTAASFAARVGLLVDLVTVEPEHWGVATDVTRPPSGRTLQLIERLTAMGLTQSLKVRHGDPALEIANAARELEADVLAIGYRRGGPPAVIEAGSVARRLVHEAPCAVLAVPL
jgi:nucleotide-binding universal stress UspA family protein